MQFTTHHGGLWVPAEFNYLALHLFRKSAETAVIHAKKPLLRLASLLLLAVAASASAYKAPMEFRNLNAAKAWFAKSYDDYAMRKETVANGPKDFGGAYGFYGPRGTGIGRVEAWYYGCDRTSCSLFAMIKYSSLRSREEEPKLSFESDSLVIRYGKGGILILK